jgi:hypothetical protein
MSIHDIDVAAMSAYDSAAGADRRAKVCLCATQQPASAGVSSPNTILTQNSERCL